MMRKFNKCHTKNSEKWRKRGTRGKAGKIKKIQKKDKNCLEI